jgi:uncharacterized protein with NRDE domain
MCLIGFAWKAHRHFDLLVAANRDEWHARPTAAAHWWQSPQDTTSIFAGRDLQAGGTWLGVTREGRFAALTNFRDPAEKKPHAPSRGELVSAFLRTDSSPETFLQSLSQRSAEYAGFNLLCADRDSIGVLSSPSNDMRMLPPGVYALSNGVLDAPWPKALAAKSGFGELLQQKMPEDARQMASLKESLEESLIALMSDTRVADDAQLPETGVGLEWERRLSAIKIVSPDYGTRCTTVLARDIDGNTNFVERTFDPRGDVTQEVRETVPTMIRT